MLLAIGPAGCCRHERRMSCGIDAALSAASGHGFQMGGVRGCGVGGIAATRVDVMWCDAMYSSSAVVVVVRW